MSASLLPPGFDDIDEEPIVVAASGTLTDPIETGKIEHVPDATPNDLLLPTPIDWVYQVLDEETTGVIGGQPLTIMAGATLKAQVLYCSLARWTGTGWIFHVVLAPAQRVWIQRDGNFWRVIEVS